MTIHGAADIAAAQDLRREVVPIPEWGGDYLIQELDLPAAINLTNWIEANLVSIDASPEERAAIVVAAAEKDPFTITGFVERVIALHLINEDGTPVYPDVETGIAALKPRSAVVKLRVATACMNLTGLTDEAVEAKADALPNSPAA